MRIFIGKLDVGRRRARAGSIGRSLCDGSRADELAKAIISNFNHPHPGVSRIAGMDVFPPLVRYRNLGPGTLRSTTLSL